MRIAVLWTTDYNSLKLSSTIDQDGFLQTSKALHLATESCLLSTWREPRDEHKVIEKFYRS
jgi:hypothetical protein